MFENLRKQGWVGNVIAALTGIVGVVGVLSIAVGYIDMVWWLVAVRTFGAPMLDIPASLGVLLGLLPIIAVAILSIRTADR